MEFLHPDDVVAGKQAIARISKGEVLEPFEAGADEFLDKAHLDRLPALLTETDE